jgi:Nucleotidyl transferase AbiEii toxin, Type IV TA system
MRSTKPKPGKLPAIEAKLETLPAAQQRLWPELTQTPPQFFLAGGTGIAVQLGHRQSRDFDFFALEAIEPDELLETVPYLDGTEVIHQERNTLTVRVKRRGSISMSYFGVPKLRRVALPRRILGTNLTVANLIDLAGYKMAVVYQRQDVKDYLDIDAILTKTDITLIDALAAAQRIYGRQFNAVLSLKALGHFGDPALAGLTKSARGRLSAAIADVSFDDMPATLKDANLAPR